MEQPFGYDADDLNLELFCDQIRTQCFGAHLRMKLVSEAKSRGGETIEQRLSRCEQ